MQPDLEVPAIPADVVEYLERLFPDRAPTLTMSANEVWFAAGATSPIRHLRHLLSTQQENILETTNVLRR